MKLDCYPENLLSKLDITIDTCDNYVEEVLPNFIYRFKKVSEYLTERERKVISLKYKLYLSLTEISKKTKLSISTIKNVEKQALEKLNKKENKDLLLYSKSKMNQDYMFEQEKTLRILRERLTYEMALQIVHEHDNASGTDIAKLGLSNRTYNALTRNRVTTVEKLLGLTINKLKRIRGLGDSSIEEIVETVKEKCGTTLPEGEKQRTMAIYESDENVLILRVLKKKKVNLTFLNECDVSSQYNIGDENDLTYGEFQTIKNWLQEE